jgi:Zn-dependent peptidase ImmA (M78 family)
MDLHLRFSRDEWIQMKIDHPSLRSIARSLGVRHNSVSLALQKHGLHDVEAKPETRKASYEAIAEHYLKTKNLGQTARFFGVSNETVSRACKALGVNPIDFLLESKNQFGLPMNEIIQRYKDGETCRELGKAFGVDDEVIRRRLVRRGVEMRSVGCRTPELNSQWAGGKGYPDEHKKVRKIVESILGRKLKSVEVIHHHNENPLDHDLDNLWIFPSPSHHARYHGKLRAIRNQGVEVDTSLLATRNDGVPLRSLISPIAGSHDKDLLAL